MSNRVALWWIVAIEIIIITVLGVRISMPVYTVSFSPLSRSDIRMATTSDRLRYYYDLSGENNTFVPDWLPYTPIYERNDDRLNERFNYATEKSASVYRILTLGDSWTFGLHVSTKDNYTERLEDILNERLRAGNVRCPGVEKFEVINLGLGGYDIEYMVESLRLRGLAYAPNLVIPLIKNDDFVIVNEIWQPKIAAYQHEFGDLGATVVDGVVRNPREEIGARVIAEVSEAYSLAELNNRGIRSLGFMDTFYDGPALLFLYTVSDSQLESLYSFARDRASTYVHIEPPLASEEKVPHDEHPGTLGHLRFAQSLYRVLTEQAILPCEISS